MNDSELQKLRYPAGKFIPGDIITKNTINTYISILEDFPGKLKQAVEGLNIEQLNTPYRPGGWTVRQVIHHMPDSHINAYTRFKLALTENIPVIKPYFEDRWANLADYADTPVNVSLDLLSSLHKRWVILLKKIDERGFKKKFYHPENDAENTLEFTLGLYAWHCNHHLAHITELIKRMNWK